MKNRIIWISACFILLLSFRLFLMNSHKDESKAQPEAEEVKEWDMKKKYLVRFFCSVLVVSCSLMNLYGCGTQNVSEKEILSQETILAENTETEETETEAGETTAEQTTAEETESSGIGENSSLMELTTDAGLKYANITAEDMNMIFWEAFERADFLKDSKHTYTVCDEAEREALYQGFLDGSVEAILTENIENSVKDSFFQKFDLDGVIQYFEEELNELYETNDTKLFPSSFRIPFEDGNEMLVVVLEQEAATSESYLLFFQATTEGLIYISCEMEYYVSGTTIYPNGLVSVYGRGGAACHYNDYYLYTENCEKIAFGSWIWESVYYYDSDIADSDCEDVMIYILELFDETVYSVCVYDDENYDYRENFDDEDQIAAFIKKADLTDSYIIQDIDYMYSAEGTFMEYVGLAYRKDEVIWPIFH